MRPPRGRDVFPCCAPAFSPRTEPPGVHGPLSALLTAEAPAPGTGLGQSRCSANTRAKTELPAPSGGQTQVRDANDVSRITRSLRESVPILYPIPWPGIRSPYSGIVPAQAPDKQQSQLRVGVSHLGTCLLTSASLCSVVSLVLVRPGDPGEPSPVAAQTHPPGSGSSGSAETC